MTAGSEASVPGSRLTSGGIARAARDAAYLLLAVSAVVWVYIQTTATIRDGAVGFDFEGTLWNAAIAIREGHSPYPEPIASEVDVGNPALYPPLLMLFVMPLTVLPWPLAAALWTAVLGAAIGGTLYILGVRDLRCYAFAFLSAPVVNGLLWGNATLLLVLPVALAWRWRERSVRCGAMVGLAIASKLFLWPLLFWLLGTRRYRTLAVATLVTGLAIMLPWAAIGFDGLTSYPDLLRVAQEFYATHGYSIATMLSALDVGTQLASNTALLVGLVIAVAAFLVGRTGRDVVAVSLAVLAAVLGSPILWEYYYSLLLVPLAIAWPRFSAAWALLPLFYFTHRLPRPHLLSTEIEPGGSACCKPEGVPLSSWVFNHAPPGLWPAAGHAVLATVIVGLVAWIVPRSSTAGRHAA